MELAKCTWCFNATDACEQVLLQKFIVYFCRKEKTKQNCLLVLNEEISNDGKTQFNLPWSAQPICKEVLSFRTAVSTETSIHV